MISQYNIYLQNKAFCYIFYRYINIIVISDISWKLIFWDFIVKLPKFKDSITEVKYNSILVIIEKLTKYIILILYYKSNIAEQLAYAFIKKIVLQYRFPEEILSDKDKLFILKF